MTPYDWLIVGAGFAGSVLAERLASELGHRVLVIDRRPHVGGNAYDFYNEHGLLIHKYGPHIFHTNSASVFDYLSKFTDWRPYEHRVLANIRGQLLPVPINLDTVNKLYGLSLTPEQMDGFLAERAVKLDEVKTSEDVVISKVGRDLYEKFFQGYTRKQWGIDASQLDKSVTARVPTRTNQDDRYFLDKFQYMPAGGYTRLFEKMLANPRIDVRLGMAYDRLPQNVLFKRLIYTGPVDEFFGYRLGMLPYRSLRFDHVTLDKEWHQPVAVVNYPMTEDYTRVTEYKHLTGQQHNKTSVTYEYATAVGDPYYPIPRKENAELYRRYEALTRPLPGVWFVGRLGTYSYYNMDQVVGQALATFTRIARQLGERSDLAGPPTRDVSSVAVH